MCGGGCFWIYLRCGHGKDSKISFIGWSFNLQQKEGQEDQKEYATAQPHENPLQPKLLGDVTGKA